MTPVDSIGRGGVIPQDALSLRVTLIWLRYFLKKSKGHFAALDSHHNHGRGGTAPKQTNAKIDSNYLYGMCQKNVSSGMKLDCKQLVDRSKTSQKNNDSRRQEPWEF
jgi:hypothetical protein